MSKQGKLLPARKQRDRPQDEDSILVRSAESIGRVIGTLQRQLDNARNQIATLGENGKPDSPASHNGPRKLKTKRPTNAGVKKPSRVTRANGGRRPSSTPTSSGTSRTRQKAVTTRPPKVKTARTARDSRARKSR